jgi:hypothetical protein
MRISGADGSIETRQRWRAGFGRRSSRRARGDCLVRSVILLQDVVTCIRHNVTIDDLGDRRERHADRYLKAPEEMHRLFSRYSEALARTIAIMERCRFSALTNCPTSTPKSATIHRLGRRGRTLSRGTA